MRVLLGADHRGFERKEEIKQWLKENGYEVVDEGASEHNKDDDYVDYARSVVEKMQDGDKGILFCGSGHGMELVANRYNGVRAVLGFNREVVIQGREDEDANILVLPTDWVSNEEVIDWMKIFLETEFSGEERHVRRLQKIQDLELGKL